MKDPLERMLEELRSTDTQANENTPQEDDQPTTDNRYIDSD